MTSTLTVGLIDYGMGNVRSVSNALVRLGLTPTIVRDRQALLGVDALILPGVGAFDAAMWNLARLRLDDPLREWVIGGRPLLGICLGMQLLAGESAEGAACRGLDLIKGRVVALPATPGLRVPHVGWNTITKEGNAGLFNGIPDGGHFYFDHSYHLECDPALVAAHFEHGGRHVAALAAGALHATQFHPEKSQQMGLRVLGNFLVEAQRTLMPEAWRKATRRA